MSDTLHNYGLIRLSKKTLKVDKALTGIGKGILQLWALQNTTKAKASILIDIDERNTVAEYIGTDSGFPRIVKDPDEFHFSVPAAVFDQLRSEMSERTSPGR